jgi:hypothetical protein
MITALLPIFGDLVSKVADNLFPNPEDEQKRLQLQAQMQAELLARQAELEKAGLENVKAEIQGESWLQRNWRPMLMLWFAGLVGAYWFGFTAPNLPESSINHLLDIVEIGIGGYIIGRSTEKAVKAGAEAFNQK